MKRKRHGGLTTALVIFLAFNVFALIFNISASETIADTYEASWYPPVLIVANLLIIVGLVALFMWKKWGFYLFAGLVVPMLAVNLSVGLGGSVIPGLLGPVILYGVLQLGEPKAWTQLD